MGPFLRSYSASLHSRARIRRFGGTTPTWIPSSIPILTIMPSIVSISCSCRAPKREEAPLSSLSFVPTARFSPYVLFVEPVDKGNGVKRVMDVYGADYADAVVFGDGSNDISMFLPEWTCVAMGNAIDELKARADFVTTDADKDAVF